MDGLAGPGGDCRGWEDKSCCCRRGLLRLLFYFLFLMFLFFFLFFFYFFFFSSSIFFPLEKKGNLALLDHTPMVRPCWALGKHPSGLSSGCLQALFSPTMLSSLWAGPQKNDISPSITTICLAAKDKPTALVFCFFLGG